MPVRLPSRARRNLADPMLASLVDSQGRSQSYSPPTPKVEQALGDEGMGYEAPFSPGRPLQPYWPQGSPPRAWNVPTGYNITTRPRATAGRVSFDTLRAIISSYDVARIAIEHICDDLRSLESRVVPADGVTADVSEAVAVAERIMRRPDGVTPFDQWLTEWLEDVLRYDAGALHIGRLRSGKAGALEVVSGVDIAPLLDYGGRRPKAPAPAYAQFLNGVPGVWMSAFNPAWKPGDLAELIYQPYRSQPESAYGLPPMEYLLMTVNTDIRFQWHFLNYFTAGNVPDSFATAPSDQSDPDMISRWQELWDGVMEGDQAQKHRVRWVPAGTTIQPARTTDTFDEKFPEYLLRRVCAAFKVTPNDLGFTLDVNRSTGETQVDVQFRVGTLPRVRYVKGVIDFFLQEVLGLPVQYDFDLGQEKEDRYQEAQAHDLYVRMGAESVDEVRETVLGLPVDRGRPMPRFVVAPRQQGPIPLAAIEASGGPIDLDTKAPSDSAQLPVDAFTPIPGVEPSKPGDVGGIIPYGPQLQAAGDDEGNDVGGTFDAAQYMATNGADASGIASTAVAKEGVVSVAGLCIKAADSGRVLMLQRSLEDDTDPARGTWEFPGGHLEDDEEPIEAAQREWSEETGCPLPDGEVRASWLSGIYQGFVLVVPHEADVCINADRPVRNSDDPDGDWIETVAWFDPADLPNMPALRPEVRDGTDWNAVAAATMPVDVVYKQALAAELKRWRANATHRVRKGQAPRRFASDVIPHDVAEAVWSRLRRARAAAEVADAFNPKEQP